MSKLHKWPKQDGEDITLKIHHKIKIHLLVVNTFYNLINVGNIEYIKIISVS